MLYLNQCYIVFAMYQEPKVHSPYRENKLGETLYDLVLEYKPEKIVEFGVLEGYSAISMAEALQALGRGHIKAYDIFDDVDISVPQKNFEIYGVADFVTMENRDFVDWALNPEDFDLMHLDISNTGDTIVMARNALENQLKKGAKIVFEGGTPERDQVEWMVKYQKTPICLVKGQINYEVIDPRFPGLSIINKP